jgi:crotonobetainyl-CoA:carnitine CoA-transferase CaiB-like acyl-CoA transferase
MPARISAWAIYDVFQTRDEPIFIGVVTDALWEKFCALFGLDALWADESLRRNNERVKARDRILPVIRELLSSFTRDEIVARLDGSGLPFAPIGRPEDMFDDPHLLASGGLQAVRFPDGRDTMLPALPIAMNGERPGGPAQLAQPPG